MIFRKFTLTLSIVVGLIAPIAFASAAAPLVPAHLRVIASTSAPYLNGNAEVTWDVVTGATQYSISLVNVETGVERLSMVTGEANNRQTFESLVGGVSYSVKVRAIAVTEVSAWSDSLQFIPQTKPKNPNKPTASAGQEKATVTWTPLVGNENGGSNVVSYKITEVNTNQAILVGATSNSADFPGLVADALASFTVTAITGVDSQGSSSVASNQVTILAVPSLTPAPTATPSPTPQQIIQGGVGGGSFPAPVSPSPSASPTPKVSKSAEPTVEPSPTPTASVSPSPLPSPSITKKVTPKPSAKPTVKASVKPSAKPSAVPAAKPTVTKKATPTPTKSTATKVDTKNWKVITIGCTNGKAIKKVSGKQPTCPKGFWRK